MQTAATRERLAGYADAINREPVHPIEDWTPEDAEEALWAAMISGLMHERLCFPENVERYARIEAAIGEAILRYSELNR